MRVDLGLLSQHLNMYKHECDFSVREMALRIGISPATMSRILNSKMPDTLSFLKCCKWLEVNPINYLTTNPK